MSFPNHPEKLNGTPVMTPADTIEMRKRFGRFPKTPAPHGLIICLKNGLPESLRWRIPVRKVGKVLGDLFLVNRTHGRVGVLANFGIGAPVVASLTEEMIAYGVREFIILSWGGALQKNLNTGDIVVAERALRDEGVSHHYVPSEPFAHADPTLTARLSAQLSAQNISFTTGATWTTDAPYRETREEILRYQAESIQTVEMEIAALFTLARYRNVRASALMVVADRLADLRWELPADMKTINRSFESAYRAAIQTLNEPS